MLLYYEKSSNAKEQVGKCLRKKQVVAVVGDIAILMSMSFILYMEWAAHLGGMIDGLVLGLVCFSL